jgi:hypothetical protein
LVPTSRVKQFLEEETDMPHNILEERSLDLKSRILAKSLLKFQLDIAELIKAVMKSAT